MVRTIGLMVQIRSCTTCTTCTVALLHTGLADEWLLYCCIVCIVSSAQDSHCDAGFQAEAGLYPPRAVCYAGDPQLDPAAD
eukprot:COSAG05_NODE_2230_length_3362_cov_2.287466_2_plen_81_part_00